jgi:hypothetical protein
MCRAIISYIGTAEQINSKREQVRLAASGHAPIKIKQFNCEIKFAFFAIIIITVEHRRMLHVEHAERMRNMIMTNHTRRT